jgi:hypothetical protein
MAVMVRTALRANEGAQAIFRLITSFGESGYEAALLLVRFDFDITRAALSFGLSRGCKACEKARTSEARRGCDKCVSGLRQRVHRVQDRVHGMLGDSMPTTRSRRPVIRFGADREGESGEKLYDRVGCEDPEVLEL